MKKPSSGYVYVASVVGNPNLCKIGYTTKSPEERISNLHKDYNGFDFELYRSFQFNRPARHELMAHNILSAARFDREIFSVTPIEGCFAVQRTIGKYFDFLTESEDEVNKSKDSPWEISGSNKTKRFFNYIMLNLSLSFQPEITFNQFQNIINTYMEIHNIRSAFDIDEGLFIELCNEAGL